VAGFIGPEVFRTREQLVRCCLEDLVMGKLHGLTIGLDICATLHMDLTLDDLDWCQAQLAPAQPAYLMALSTKIDPMLGYLSTGVQDHVRLREAFGFRVNDPMWAFFQRLGVIGQDGQPTARFGDPLWVHLQFQKAKGDPRPVAEILAEGRASMLAVRERGVFLAHGHGPGPADLEPELEREIRGLYADAKRSIWTELEPGFLGSLPGFLRLRTRSWDREDYLLHPETGEQLLEAALADLARERERQGGRFDAQLVVSDGLNAQAIADPGHLTPCLAALTKGLEAAGYRVAPTPILILSGRVRAGYQVGEQLFGGLAGPRVLLHLIGERPGSGHHTFSIYLTKADGQIWGTPGRIDHSLTRVVSGLALTARDPVQGAGDALGILGPVTARSGS
jgi:ethanolamine ammonia-lyase large subunit